MYNSAYLYTVEERVQLLASGQITEKDAISAQFVFDAVTELYYDDGFDIMGSDYTTIKNAIDAKLAPRFEAVASVEVPQIDMNQFAAAYEQMEQSEEDDNNDSDSDNDNQ
jgi:hypothetical protein